MNLYVFDIGEKARTAARFIGHVRAELQRALALEKSARKLTQQQIATMIGTNRSVINREIMGFDNLTLRRVAELAWALGWEVVFFLRKRDAQQNCNDSCSPMAAGKCDTETKISPLTGSRSEKRHAA